MYSMQLSPTQIKTFQKKILAWYKKNIRDLPWRHTHDPYKILVSEIMLQQTQVPRVIPKYEKWFEAFPNIQSLAKGKTSEVLSAWSGLGYNRRALNLRKAAGIIVTKYRGKFPKNEKELIKLPGIGTYTARAILSFAFNEQVAVVDTNVRKVILTHFLHRHPGKRCASRTFLDSGPSNSAGKQARMTEKEVQNIADQLLPAGKAYDWNHAMMDYTAIMLKQEKIPLKKQSTFIGSNRYFRGQILKLLLEKKKISFADLENAFRKEHVKEHREWMDKLVTDLAKEGFVVLENDAIELAS